MIERIMGIYAIHNKITEYDYIGSSVNIYKRYRKHISELNRRIHPNMFLQNDWEIYKPDNFICLIIEEIKNKSELLEKEQIYIDKQELKYNMGRALGWCKCDWHISTPKGHESCENKYY